MPSPRRPSKSPGRKLTFFQAISANRDSNGNKVRLYKSCGDFLAGADAQACVPDVIADLTSDWGLAAAQLEQDVRSPDRQLAQYVLYFAGNLLSHLDIMAGCPHTAQRRLLLMLLHHGACGATNKETFKMAAWCLSCQRVAPAVVAGVLTELLSALAGILEGTPLVSRLAQQYALTALGTLVEQSPSGAVAEAEAWLPATMRKVLDFSSGEGNQTAVLRRDARSVLLRLVTARDGSLPEQFSDCVATSLLKHGLLDKMESAVQTVCAMAPRCSGSTPPVELAVALDAIASWALVVKLLGRRFLRGKGGAGSSAAGQRMLKIIQSTFTIQRSVLVGLPVASFSAWCDLAGMLQAQGELPLRRISGLIMVPIMHAITNHIQPDVYKAAVGAWKGLLHTLGIRLEDPAIYQAVASDVLDICVSLMTRQSQPPSSGAAWARHMGIIQEVCGGLSSHLWGGASSQQGQSDLTAARQMDVAPWLCASPSRCMDLLRSCARIEEAIHKCSGGLTKDSMESYVAARHAVVELWQSAAAAIASGFCSGSPGDPEVACWLRVLQEEADLMLNTSASRTRRLPDATDNGQLAGALGDFERKTLLQQLAALKALPARALTSEEAASPIGRILWEAVCQAGATESPPDTAAASGPPITPLGAARLQPATSPCLSPAAGGLGSAGKAVMRFLMAAPETAVPRTPSTPFSPHMLAGRAHPLQPSATPPGEPCSQADAGPPLSPAVKFAAAGLLIHAWAPAQGDEDTACSQQTVLSAIQEMMGRLVEGSGSSPLGTAASLTAALLQLSDGILFLAQRPGRCPVGGDGGSRRADRLLDGLLAAWVGSVTASLASVSAADLADAAPGDDQTLSCHVLMLIPLKSLATFESARPGGTLVPEVPETWQQLCRLLFSLASQQDICRRHLLEFLRHNLQWRSLPLLGRLLDLAAQQLGAASAEELEAITNIPTAQTATPPARVGPTECSPAAAESDGDKAKQATTPDRPVQAERPPDEDRDAGACLHSVLSPSPAPQARTKSMAPETIHTAVPSSAAAVANTNAIGSQSFAAEQHSQPGSQGGGRQLLLDGTRTSKKPRLQAATAAGRVTSADTALAEGSVACPLAGSSNTAALLGPVCATSISRRLAAAGSAGFSKTSAAPLAGTAATAALAQQRAAGSVVPVTRPKRKAVPDMLDSSQTEYVVITTKRTKPDKSLMTERQREVLERQRKGLNREGLTLYTSLDPSSQSQHCSLSMPGGPPSPPRPSKLAPSAEAQGASLPKELPQEGAADGSGVMVVTRDPLLPIIPHGKHTPTGADAKTAGALPSGGPSDRHGSGLETHGHPTQAVLAVRAGDGRKPEGTDMLEPSPPEEAVSGTPEDGAEDHQDGPARRAVALSVSPDSAARPAQAAGSTVDATRPAGLGEDSSAAVTVARAAESGGEDPLQPARYTDAAQPAGHDSSQPEQQGGGDVENVRQPTVGNGAPAGLEDILGAEEEAGALGEPPAAGSRALGLKAGGRGLGSTRPAPGAEQADVCGRGPSDLDIRELELVATQEIPGRIAVKDRSPPGCALRADQPSPDALLGALAKLSDSVQHGGLGGATPRGLLTAQAQLASMLAKVSSHLMVALGSPEGDPCDTGSRDTTK